MATTRLDIGAAPDDVFAVLADGWSYADWVVGAKTIRAVDDGFPRVGARLHHRIGVKAATIDDVTEVIECDPPHHLALRASAGPLGQAMIAFDVEPTEEGSSITMKEHPVGDAAPAKAGRRADRLLRVRNAETMWRLKVVVERRAGRHPSAPAATARLPGPVTNAIVRLFATVAVVREARSLHPRGTTLHGAAAIHPAGRALAAAQDVPVVARLSRGIGLPHPLPDFNGIGVRFLDAHGSGRHQDLLLTSARGSPVLRHLLLPAPTFSGSGYSTVLPYRTPSDGLRLFGCKPLPVRTLHDTGAARPIELELRIASVFGAWQRAATISLQDIVPDDAIRFDPWNTSEALMPAGLLNRLRSPAYAASRAATP